MKMLKRIKYVSRFARSLTAEEIDELVVQAERNNREKEITGILVACGDIFFQIIEGPAKHIDDLYGRIEKDPRHQDVLLLNSSWGVIERIFPDWSLRKVDLEACQKHRLEVLRVLLETIVESGNRLEVLTNTLERAVWEEFLSD